MFYRLVNIAILQNFQFHRKCLQNLNELYIINPIYLMKNTIEIRLIIITGHTWFFLRGKKKSCIKN